MALATRSLRRRPSDFLRWERSLAPWVILGLYRGFYRDNGKGSGNNSRDHIVQELYRGDVGKILRTLNP